MESSIRLINDILEYKDENDIEALLFSANFEKAFDSVEHSFIISTLRAFGFGSDFIHWVETFFKNVKRCVMNNCRSTGYSPRKRHPTRRPSLCLLFILALKVILIQIRENADITGIIIDETEIKLSAYADDGSFSVTDVQSIQLIFSCVINPENSHFKAQLRKI